MRKTLIGVAALCSIALMGTVTSPTALAKTHHKVTVTDPTIYNSIDAPLPGNNASQSFEATQTSEFGNQIVFGGTARVLANVVVTMSSFACQTGSGTSCVTNPGSTFTEPVTLNVYNVGANNAVGSLITTETQTFAIPFRPSALPTGTCSATNSPDGMAWYDPVTNKCVHGLFNNITFNFGHVIVPNAIIYGIAYNTDTAGYHPLGVGGPWDGLNVGYSVSPSEPSVGSDPNLGTNYLNGNYAPFYCDNGVTGTFRIDGRPDTNNCWNGGGYNTGYSYQGIEFGGPVLASQVSPYVIPSVQFHAVNSPSPSFTSLSTANVVAGTPFSFTVTTTGVPVPIVSMVGRKLPKGLAFQNNGDGTATISGTASVRNRNKNYSIVIKARNARNSSAKQRLTLTLTGGR
jgi:hypothetical protein